MASPLDELVYDNERLQGSPPPGSHDPAFLRGPLYNYYGTFWESQAHFPHTHGEWKCDFIYNPPLLRSNSNLETYQALADPVEPANYYTSKHEYSMCPSAPMTPNIDGAPNYPPHVDGPYYQLIHNALNRRDMTRPQWFIENTNKSEKCESKAGMESSIRYNLDGNASFDRRGEEWTLVASTVESTNRYRQKRGSRQRPNKVDLSRNRDIDPPSATCSQYSSSSRRSSTHEAQRRTLGLQRDPQEMMSGMQQGPKMDHILAHVEDTDSFRVGHRSGGRARERCEVDGCTKIYQERTHLNRHKRTAHGIGDEVKIHTCPAKGCGKSFKGRFDNFKRHLELHKPDKSRRTPYDEEAACLYDELSKRS